MFLVRVAEVMDSASGMFARGLREEVLVADERGEELRLVWLEAYWMLEEV
jgi:hypothetical protein